MTCLSARAGTATQKWPALSDVPAPTTVSWVTSVTSCTFTGELTGPVPQTDVEPAGIQLEIRTGMAVAAQAAQRRLPVGSVNDTVPELPKDSASAEPPVLTKPIAG